jgi:hypothetical protein
MISREKFLADVEYLKDPRFVCPYSPHAEWKRALIRFYAQKYDIPAFIETGSCYGTTVGAVREYFKEVKSVEIEPVMYSWAKRHHGGNAKMYFGNSTDLLPKMIEETNNRPILFWLDAHITGGTTIDLGNIVPLELDLIDRLAPQSLVLIDDVKPSVNNTTDPRGDFDGPSGPLGLPNEWHQAFLSGVLVCWKDKVVGWGERYPDVCTLS